MCGRAILTLSMKLIQDILTEEYDVGQMTLEDYYPNYNIAPGQKLVSVVHDGQINRAGLLNWIYVPPWAKSAKEGYKYINARSETIDQKPTFKASFHTRRCIVLVDGFYEWQKSEKGKTPYRFFRPDEKVFALAGIWTPYEDCGKKYGVSILTTEANSLMAPIHHRMPLVIENKDIPKWLKKDTPIGQVKELIKPVDENYFTFHAVSPYVNSSKNKGIQCIKKITTA